MTPPWPEGSSFGQRGLELSGTAASELADRFGTPVVVVDEEHVRARCRAFKEAFPRVLWAVKAFPAGALIRIALEEGLGVLVATGGELDACVRSGARGERIVFHGNNKSDEELALAMEVGVGLVIADSEEDLERIASAAASTGRRQPVLLRVAPGVDVETHRFVATGMTDTKFGIPLPLAMRALKRSLALGDLDVRGVHLHLGSQLLDSVAYLSGLEVALGFLEEAKAELGFEARVLDTGGGMGVAYTSEHPIDIPSLAASVGRALEDGCAARGLPVPELLVEPGRAITSNAAVTLYRVGSVKEVPGVRTFVAVDGGMSDNLRPALYGSRYTIALASRRSEAAPEPVTVVGRHCETGDELARDIELPGDVRRGDLLAFASTGAYEYAMSSNYNKVGRPAVTMISEGGARLVLRREDAGDLSRLEVPSAGDREARVPDGVMVRPARAGDARGLRELVEQVASEGRYIRTEGRPAMAALRRRVRRGWTRSGAELVAIAGGKQVGHLGIVREGHPGLRHVASLGMAVLPEWRGKGIGAALMSEAFRWARWAGVEKISLTVFPHNVRAAGLYRRFGFVEEGRLVRHTKKTSGYDDEIVMGAWV